MATAVPQERRRLANASPARPSPKRERLIGSGTDTDVVENVSVSPVSRAAVPPVFVMIVFPTGSVVVAGNVTGALVVGPVPLRMPEKFTVAGPAPPKVVSTRTMLAALDLCAVRVPSSMAVPGLVVTVKLNTTGLPLMVVLLSTPPPLPRITASG